MINTLVLDNTDTDISLSHNKCTYHPKPVLKQSCVQQLSVSALDSSPTRARLKTK